MEGRDTTPAAVGRGREPLDTGPLMSCGLPRDLGGGALNINHTLTALRCWCSVFHFTIGMSLLPFSTSFLLNIEY